MWIWFFIGLVFLVVEGLNFGLISIWFAIGAFVTMFFSKFSFEYQFYIFIIISGLSLIFIRKFAVFYLKGKNSELDRITKSKVQVEDIKLRGNIKIYEIKLDGKIWEGVSQDELELKEVAEVEKIKGNKLVLKKLVKN